MNVTYSAAQLKAAVKYIKKHNKYFKDHTKDAIRSRILLLVSGVAKEQTPVASMGVFVVPFYQGPDDWYLYICVDPVIHKDNLADTEVTFDTEKRS